MKKLLILVAASLAVASCNKDDNTDSFCAAVELSDWATVETVLVAEADNYIDTVWQNNARSFSKTLSEKDCVDTAFARLYVSGSTGSTPETEVVIWYAQGDTAIKRIETLYIGTSGVLSLKKKYK